MASIQKRAKKSKKNRKHGRNELFCAAYRREGRREINKCVRLRKHLATHPTDNVAKHCLANGGPPLWRPLIFVRNARISAAAWINKLCSGNRGEGQPR